ncbi:MAG TPA: PIN domain-containing protein [Mycobacteriales bacterium]
MVRYVVLDTDVASRTIRGKLDGSLAARLTGYTWYVSFIIVGELWQWSETTNWGRRSRAELERWLGHVGVIDSDEAVSRTWGRICAAAARRGRPRQVNDSWIAACCLANGIPLATLNLKDYLDFADHEGLILL